MSDGTLPVRDRGLAFVIVGIALAGIAIGRGVIDGITGDLDLLGVVLSVLQAVVGFTFLFFGTRLRRQGR